MFRLTCLVVIYSTFACSAENTAPIDVGDEEIRSGTAVQPDQFQYVGIFVDANGLLCSGSLLDSTHVLTAAHCAVLDRSSMVFSTEVGPPFRRFVPVAELVVHPSYNASAPLPQAHDLAIARLSAPIELPVYASLSSDGPTPSLSLLGYGRFETTGGSGYKRVGQGVFDPTYLGARDLLAPWLFAVTEGSTKQIACSGDSGGPALASDGRVVGVLHAGADVGCSENPFNLYAVVAGESFITRELLPYHNPRFGLDVDNDGYVSASDSLRVINAINSLGSGFATRLTYQPPENNFLDADGDSYVTASDVLMIINYINRNGAGPTPVSSL